MSEELDRALLARALELAARGDWRTRPNPRVGAVIARDGVVLAEGWHAEAGGPHAEAAALAALAASGGSARGATLYVTLEPCGAFAGKRTPPCVDAVLASGVARVVVAMADPHPAASGRSLLALRAAGIAVEVGLRSAEARRLNGEYLKRQAGAAPYVTAKWAMSLDGRIATRSGESRWISSEASRRLAHRLRGEADAVLVGIGTALRDDPLLTRRDAPGGDPLRVVLDSQARLSPRSQLAQSARRSGSVLLATTEAAPSERLAALAAEGVEVLALPARDGRVEVPALLRALAGRGVRHLVLEGGGEVIGAFLAVDAIDRVLAFVGPLLIGGEGAPGPVGGLGVDHLRAAPRLLHLEARPSGEDLLLEGHIHLW